MSDKTIPALIGVLAVVSLIASNKKKQIDVKKAEILEKQKKIVLEADNNIPVSVPIKINKDAIVVADKFSANVYNSIELPTLPPSQNEKGGDMIVYKTYEESINQTPKPNFKLLNIARREAIQREKTGMPVETIETTLPPPPLTIYKSYEESINQTLKPNFKLLNEARREYIKKPAGTLVETVEITPEPLPVITSRKYGTIDFSSSTYNKINVDNFKDMTALVGQSELFTGKDSYIGKKQDITEKIKRVSRFREKSTALTVFKNDKEAEKKLFEGEFSYIGKKKLFKEKYMKPEDYILKNTTTKNYWIKYVKQPEKVYVIDGWAILNIGTVTLVMTAINFVNLLYIYRIIKGFLPRNGILYSDNDGGFNGPPPPPPQPPKFGKLQKLTGKEEPFDLFEELNKNSALEELKNKMEEKKKNDPIEKGSTIIFNNEDVGMIIREEEPVDVSHLFENEVNILEIDDNGIEEVKKMTTEEVLQVLYENDDVSVDLDEMKDVSSEEEIIEITNPPTEAPKKKVRLNFKEFRERKKGLRKFTNVDPNVVLNKLINEPLFPEKVEEIDEKEEIEERTVQPTIPMERNIDTYDYVVYPRTINNNATEGEIIRIPEEIKIEELPDVDMIEKTIFNINLATIDIKDKKKVRVISRLLNPEAIRVFLSKLGKKVVSGESYTIFPNERSREARVRYLYDLGIINKIENILKDYPTFSDNLQVIKIKMLNLVKWVNGYATMPYLGLEEMRKLKERIKEATDIILQMEYIGNFTSKSNKVGDMYAEMLILTSFMLVIMNYVDNGNN